MLLETVTKERQLSFLLDDPPASPIPNDPESEFLNTISLSVYPELKARYPNISIREIHQTAESFRGARVTKFIPILIVKTIKEQRTPSHQLPQGRQLSFEIDIQSQKPSSLIDRLKKPLHLIGIKF